MKKFLVLAIFVSILSLPLMAQEKVDIFGGYQYSHFGGITEDGSTSNGQGFNGWDGSAIFNFNKHLGVAADFGGGYATISGVTSHVYTYTGGPVLSLDAGGRINPFVHALFGGTRLSASADGVSEGRNGFTTMFGGGVDVKANRVIAVRLIQVDWLYYHFGSTTIDGESVPSVGQSNNVRIATGIVFRF